MSRPVLALLMLLTLIAALGGSTRAIETTALSVGSDAENSCFRNSIALPQASAIERATIFLGVVRADGSLLAEGTGFVVQGKGRSGPKIVTAAHVVETDSDDYPADAQLTAFFSDGTLIGRVGVLVSGLAHDATVGGVDVTLDDVAVVEVVAFAGAAARDRFQRIEGLHIATGSGLMVGEASNPAVVWGFSGAPAVDSSGRVVGVVTGADFRGQVKVELGAINNAQAGHPAVRQVTLPSDSLVVVEPLHAPEILQTLEPAISSTPGAEVPVTIAGYPLASCAATAASLTPAESSAGGALLAKWRTVAPTAAWMLPPKLGVMNLR